MPSYTITFTPADTYSTTAGEIIYQVRTASGGGGTLLTSGAATSGVEVTTASINDTGLVHGSNTRWLRLTDGAANVLDQSVSVEAALSVPVEITSTISGSSTVAAVLTAPSLITADIAGASTVDAILETVPQLAVDVAGSSTVDATLIAPGPALITVDVSGVATMDAGLTASAHITATIDGPSTVDATLSRPKRITALVEGHATVDANLTAPALITANIDGPSTVDAEIVTTPSFTVDIDGQATVDATIQTTPLLSVTISGASTVDAKLGIPAVIEAEIVGQSSAQVVLTTPVQLAVDITGTSTMDVRILQRQRLTGQRLRADLYNPDGDLLAGLFTILRPDYGGTLDGIGTFSLEVPAFDPVTVYLTPGTELRLYRDGEGLCFRGIVAGKETLIDAAGNLTVHVTGDSIARQLVWANTLLGREFSNTAMSSVASTLLTGTGWTANSVDSDSRNLTAQYEGASIWQALLHAAETFGWHLRERNLERTIDIGAFGDSSGLVFQNVEHVELDMGVLPIIDLRVRESQDELWNRVIPIGGGDGINKLTLRYSDRNSPYTIQSDTGPDGQTYWYIEDSASVAEHGLRVKVLSVDDVVPISNSDAEIENAANALYDITAAWLGWHSGPQESYEVEITGLRHIEETVPTFRVGDTVRLIYRGVVYDEDGRRLWKAVDDDLYIMGFRRSFQPDGSDRWQFEVSTTDREIPSDAEAITQAIEDLWAVQTAKRPYTYQDTFGPYVESIASGNSATFPIRLDEQVTYLHKATLSVRSRRVKSNVSGAAAGGGQTSSSGGGQTTSSGGGQTSSSDGAHSHGISTATSSSGGGQTSSGGTAHSHTVSGQTAAGSGEHFHQIGQAGSTSSWEQQPFQQQLVLQTGPQTGPNHGMFVGRGSSSSGVSAFSTAITTTHTHTVDGTTSTSESAHTHSVSNHSHSVSGQTAASGGAHSHTVSNHTHTVSNHTHTVADHVHSLVYGMFSGPVANSPNLNITINGVNRTTELGGPWNGSPILDVTQYLVDAQGHVLRQNNDIEISSSQLMDVEVTLKALLTSTSVVPV